ncbi:ABC transporter ATPase [Flavobacteriaceae bacterium F08102]|nr:ABC transporter ATPase [Flavobacteriaceae bacterium F08102]
MLIDFNKLPDTSRIWIYQANRTLTRDEVQQVKSHMNAFLPTWKSHGEEINVSMNLAYNQFLVLAVDESLTGASGCSIDSSVRAVSALGQLLNVDFFNKLNIAYLQEDKVYTVSVPKFKELVVRKEVTENTLVFNNMITKKGDLEKQWIIPAKDSWLCKYFKTESSI